MGQHVQARAKADPRIRYQKLTENEGIAGNTNHGFELATGDYIALLDHDDILHPCALWYTAQAIVEQGADFVYTDADGRTVVEDVKGFRTKEYLIRRKLMLFRYGIRIQEVEV